MRIVVLHNAVTADSPADEQDVLLQARAVGQALTSLGHAAVAVACDLDLDALRRYLVKFRPDLVFNLVESLNGSGRLIAAAPFLLDSLGIPYTGASAEALYATSGKVMAKERMDQAGSQWDIFSPAWIGPYSLLKAGRLSLRPSEKIAHPLWIVKSVWEHASLGLDDKAVLQVDRVQDVLDGLAARVSALGGDCFAEWYVEGREFNLSLLQDGRGVETLPPAEIVFEGYAADKPRIVDYRAKWQTDSFEYAHTVRRFDFPAEDGTLLERMQTIARRCWDLFHLSGYARVDFRVDARGNPWVLEINANPCLSPDAGFAAALARAGIAYERAVERILTAAVRPDANEAAKTTVPPPAAVKPAPETASGGPAGRFRYEARPEDLPEVRALLATTGFFYADEIDTAGELIAERLAKGPDSDYYFVFCDDDAGLAGYTCYGPVPCTQSAYDVYWIAVRPDLQGKGRGRELMAETERLIAAAGGTQIYVDTSGRPQYDPTRSFYERCGFLTTAVLADFYGPQDDKVIYRKTLAESSSG